MLETLFELVGMNLTEFNIDHNVLFVVVSFTILYCIGYMFNFITTCMERLTAKKR